MKADQHQHLTKIGLHQVCKLADTNSGIPLIGIIAGTLQSLVDAESADRLETMIRANTGLWFSRGWSRHSGGTN